MYHVLLAWTDGFMASEATRLPASVRADRGRVTLGQYLIRSISVCGQSWHHGLRLLIPAAAVPPTADVQLRTT